MGGGVNHLLGAELGSNGSNVQLARDAVRSDFDYGFYGRSRLSASSAVPCGRLPCHCRPDSHARSVVASTENRCSKSASVAWRLAKPDYVQIADIRPQPGEPTSPIGRFLSILFAQRVKLQPGSVTPVDRCHKANAGQRDGLLRFDTRGWQSRR